METDRRFIGDWLSVPNQFRGDWLQVSSASSWDDPDGIKAELGINVRLPAEWEGNEESAREPSNLDPVRVYRIENGFGEGPYQQGHTDALQKMYDHHSSSPYHPVPENDGIPRPDGKLHGFTSMDALHRWFQGYQEDLHDAGFGVSEYHVDPAGVVHGGHQVAFDPDLADQKRWLTLPARDAMEEEGKDPDVPFRKQANVDPEPGEGYKWLANQGWNVQYRPRLKMHRAQRDLPNGASQTLYRNPAHLRWELHTQDPEGYNWSSSYHDGPQEAHEQADRQARAVQVPEDLGEFSPDRINLRSQIDWPIETRTLFDRLSAEGRTTVYHLTDDPRFRLDADYAPEDNSISINPRDGRRGLYVGRPEVWRGPPYGYKRPYVVELSMPTGTKEGGRWGGESFIPAEHFGDVRVERVMPYDHYIRREFKSPGETEDYTGHTYDTHEPLERTPKQWGARYPESVDTEKEIDTRNPQQWSEEQHRAYLKQRREYLHDVHGWGWNEFRDDDSFNTDPDNDPRHWDDEGEFIRTDRQGNRMTRGRYASTKPTFFHGTNHLFGPGDMIEAGHPSNYGFDPESHVYFTNDETNAHQWAQDSDMSLLDRTSAVEDIHDSMTDPATGDSVRVPGHWGIEPTAHWSQHGVPSLDYEEPDTYALHSLQWEGGREGWAHYHHPMEGDGEPSVHHHEDLPEAMSCATGQLQDEPGTDAASWSPHMARLLSALGYHDVRDDIGRFAPTGTKTRDTRRVAARERPTWSNRMQEPNLLSEFGSVKVPGLLPSHTIHYHPTGEGAACGARTPEGSSNNVTHVTCNKCTTTRAFKMAPTEQNPNGKTWDQVEREDREAAKQRHRDWYHKASANADLRVEDYAGREGNNTHITRNEYGTVPLAWIRHLHGGAGEKPYEHRNYTGEQWDDFREKVRAGEPGYSSPIFIVVEHGKEPRIYEGNHRRTAYDELERMGQIERPAQVPVEVRYFGHAERQGDLGERYMRRQGAQSAEPSWLADYNPEHQLEGIPREPVRPGDPGKGTGENWWEYDKQPNKLQAEAMPRDKEYLNDLDFHFKPASGRVLYHSIMAMPHGADPENLFAAHGGITWWPAGNGSTSGKIMNVAVNDDRYKRRGLATELLRRAKAKAAEEGLTLRHSLSLLDDGEQMIAGIGDYPGGPVLQAESASAIQHQGDSPLDYNMGTQPGDPWHAQRLGMVDHDAGEPARGETYFAEGRQPAAAPGTVAFVDYSHPDPGLVYIHYMSTRRDQGGRGHQRRLVEDLIVRHPGVQTVDFGKEMEPAVTHLRQSMQEAHPEIYFRGKVQHFGALGDWSELGFAEQRRIERELDAQHPGRMYDAKGSYPQGYVTWTDSAFPITDKGMYNGLDQPMVGFRGSDAAPHDEELNSGSAVYRHSGLACATCYDKYDRVVSEEDHDDQGGGFHTFKPMLPEPGERRFASAPFDDEYWSQFDHPPEYAQLVGKGWDAHDMGDRETIYTKGLPEGHSLTLWKRPNPRTGNMWWTMSDSTQPHDPAKGVYRGSWHRTLDDALETARGRGHNVDTYEHHPEPPMSAEEEAEMERQEAQWARQREQQRPDLPEGDEYRSGPGGGRQAAIQRRIAATSWDEGPDAGHIADFERMGWKRADPEGYAWHMDDPQTGTQHAADWLGNEGWFLTSTAPKGWRLHAPDWVSPQIERDVEDAHRYKESEHETPAQLHEQAKKNAISFGGFGQTGPKHLRGVNRPEYGLHETVHDYVPEPLPSHSIDYDQDRENMRRYNKTAGRTPRPRHPDPEMENRLRLLKDRAKPSRVNSDQYREFWEKVMREHGGGVPPEDHQDFGRFMDLTDPVPLGAPKRYPGMSPAEVRQQWMATPAGQEYQERNRQWARDHARTPEQDKAKRDRAEKRRRDQAAAETRMRMGQGTPADIKAWYERQGVPIDDEAALELHRQRQTLRPQDALRGDPRVTGLHQAGEDHSFRGPNDTVTTPTPMPHTSMGLTDQDEGNKAFDYDDPDAVYLRFGDWPKNERSENFVTGQREFGVSAYDLSKQGEPLDSDSAMNRGVHHYDPSSCGGLEDYGGAYGPECEEHRMGDGETDPDYWNDTASVMWDKIENARYTGNRVPGARAHLVKGEFVGFGHDDEPLLKNVRAVGHWPCDVHKFVPGLTSNSGAAANFGTQWCNHHDHDEPMEHEAAFENHDKLSDSWELVAPK